MCGIIGYVGGKEAGPILLEGLKKLEYRGYDSSGVGVISSRDGKIHLRKTKGKIRDLETLLHAHKLPAGHIGVSHTRWATHGQPNKVNAHPHQDIQRRILLVHNGIIENYQEIRDALKKQGAQFVSETDTEVIVQLISYYHRGVLLESVQKAIKRLRGSFALGIISDDSPETLIAVRVGSPLIIGVGKNENFIASDVPAILNHTKRVVYLQDEQIAIIKKDNIKILSFSGKEIKYKIDTVSFSTRAAQKEGFPHFMLKEIHEQPKAIAQMLSSRIVGRKIRLDGLNLNDRQLGKIKNIIIVGCGTAYHAGMVGKYMLETWGRIPVSIDMSSEFRYRRPIIQKNTLVLAISQSGETADTLAAIREARRQGAKIISVCNVVGSSLIRESDGVLYTYAGPEIGVASTKAYTTQICMLYLLALKIAVCRKTMSVKACQKIIRDLKQIPVLYTAILKSKTAIARVARRNSHFGSFLYLGRNINFPSALEGALKLKEISYIPAEGYAAGEMKHGPIALIDEYRAVVCIVPESDIYDKMISNMQEIRSRRGKIIAIATEGNNEIKNHANHVIFIPLCGQLLTPLLVALPLQLIAYYIAVKRGCDVDQPRNLAKSVTVE